MRRSYRTVRTPRLIATLVAFSACAAGDESAVPADQLPVTQAVQAADSPSSAPPLVPSSTFRLATEKNVTGVAMSPDGTTIVVSTQTNLGDPVTLRLYDAATGAPGASVEFETISLGPLHWMADNRLVASDRDPRRRWRSWDGNTLVEQPALPQDEACADGQVDRMSGAVYFPLGVQRIRGTICRFDTNNGQQLMMPEGMLVEPQRYWVRPGSEEIVVLHYPDPDPQAGREMVILDGRTFERKSAVTVPIKETVEAVGTTVWISNRDTRTARLEPGGSAVPYYSMPTESGAGTMFVHSNGKDDFVFYSATDGHVIGSMPPGMNLLTYADWSVDDSAFVRLTVDRTVEVYRFGAGR